MPRVRDLLTPVTPGEGDVAGRVARRGPRPSMEPLIDLVRAHARDGERHAEYVRRSLPHVEKAVSEIAARGVAGQRVCEIGFGAIGLACHVQLGVRVEAYDVDDAYRPLCEQLGIPWRQLDLTRPITDTPREPYDLIVLCEVIEHIMRSPIEVLAELRSWLRPGGALLLSTVNLARLSNRFRLLAGRELFARFEPHAFVMAHYREYAVEEILGYVRLAGYHAADPALFAMPDPAYSWPYRIGYLALTRLAPRLSNLVYIWGTNP